MIDDLGQKHLVGGVLMIDSGVAVRAAACGLKSPVFDRLFSLRSSIRRTGGHWICRMEGSLGKEPAVHRQTSM
jgi:hypothetical protein